MPLSWAELDWVKKLRNIKNYQNCLAWSPLSGYVTKSWLQSQFVVKKGSFTFGSSKHIANELIARKLGWIESLCLYQKTCIAYTYNLPQFHFGQLHRKNFLIFLGFVNKSNVDNFPFDYMSCPIHATLFGHQGCIINWIFQ